MQNGGEIQDDCQTNQKFKPLEFGKLGYLKNIIENCLKKYKLAEQSNFVVSLQLFDFSTDQKNKIHYGFVIWSSN
jgi:hypothetical protein